MSTRLAAIAGMTSPCLIPPAGALVWGYREAVLKARGPRRYDGAIGGQGRAARSRSAALPVPTTMADEWRPVVCRYTT